VARSPIRPAGPGAPGLLADESMRAKTLVRAPAGGDLASALAVSFGRAARDGAGALITGSGPGEWTILGAVGGGGVAQRARYEAVAAAVTSGELITVLDLTHGRALIRLTGSSSRALLAKVCAIDLADHRTPNGTALRTSVAKLVTDLVRDDEDGVPSYLLHCERSSGQYLWDALADAGAEFTTGASR
jgi:heterotetrameric sarcosine oxidase gamma subunit